VGSKVDLDGYGEEKGFESRIIWSVAVAKQTMISSTFPPHPHPPNDRNQRKFVILNALHIKD
jgi:hypothetical protein